MTATMDHTADRQRRDALAMARAMALPRPELAGPAALHGGGEDVDRIAMLAGFSTYPEPVDCGHLALSTMGSVQYVTDLIIPGRIHIVAAEEGTGKTYGLYELAIRMAAAGGSFAGTWPIEVAGPVVYLSEMHPDDDWRYQQDILDSLDMPRSVLTERLFRLDLGTAANGAPVLTDPDWRTWFTLWSRRRGIRLAVFDTGTGATQVDPWGKAIQQVYRDLRLMLAEYPELAVVLLLHLKKPQGRGSRRISDVLGEWGRWCDVLVLMEADGTDRTKVSTHKRLRHHRRIVATRSGGLLTDPQDLTDGVPTRKVPEARVLAVIAAQPGIGYSELAAEFGVAKSTAENYVRALGGRVTRTPSGPKGAIQLSLTAQPPNTTQHEGLGGWWAVPEDGDGGDHPTTQPPIDRWAVGWAVTTPSAPDGASVEDDYPASAWETD